MNFSFLFAACIPLLLPTSFLSDRIIMHTYKINALMKLCQMSICCSAMKVHVSMRIMPLGIYACNCLALPITFYNLYIEMHVSAQSGGLKLGYDVCRAAY